jgi:hypothetical protein
VETSSANAGLVAIYAALAYDIIAASNSSPQTTEINAGARSETLMKWVHIGEAQVVLMMLIGAYIQHKTNQPVWPPILGSVLGGGLMYIQYIYARNCGLNSDEPGTENYA